MSSSSDDSSDSDPDGPDNELILQYLNDFEPHRYPTGAALQPFRPPQWAGGGHNSFTERTRRDLAQVPGLWLDSRVTSATDPGVEAWEHRPRHEMGQQRFYRPASRASHHPERMALSPPMPSPGARAPPVRQAGAPGPSPLRFESGSSSVVVKQHTNPGLGLAITTGVNRNDEASLVDLLRNPHLRWPNEPGGRYAQREPSPLRLEPIAGACGQNSVSSGPCAQDPAWRAQQGERQVATPESRLTDAHGHERIAGPPPVEAPRDAQLRRSEVREPEVREAASYDLLTVEQSWWTEELQQAFETRRSDAAGEDVRSTTINGPGGGSQAEVGADVEPDAEATMTGNRQQRQIGWLMDPENGGGALRL
ncbi:hypothetical protein LTR53_001103 [Teratosphaeriaceae sp. CCFEE 6253]|nr:hypothetical protein LTR53_001103 [Teratosphaeriaceae sp. CCFEE 6253]